MIEGQDLALALGQFIHRAGEKVGHFRTKRLMVGIFLF